MEIRLEEDAVKAAVTASIEKLVISQGKGLIDEILRDIIGENRRGGGKVFEALRRLVAVEIDSQLAEYLAANENTIRERVVTAISQEVTADRIAQHVTEALRRTKFEVSLGEKAKKSAPINEDEDEE